MWDWILLESKIMKIFKFFAPLLKSEFIQTFHNTSLQYFVKIDLAENFEKNPCSSQA